VRNKWGEGNHNVAKKGITRSLFILGERGNSKEIPLIAKKKKNSRIGVRAKGGACVRLRFRGKKEGSQ